MNDINLCYLEFRSCSPLADSELLRLLAGIEAAMPYLESHPDFSLMRNQANRDLEQLRGYAHARGLAGGQPMIIKPVTSYFEPAEGPVRYVVPMEARFGGVIIKLPASGTI